MTKTKYAIGRPRLACHLMAAGFEGKRLPNPYRDNFYIWEFDDTEALREAIKAYVDGTKKGGDSV